MLNCRYILASLLLATGVLVGPPGCRKTPPAPAPAAGAASKSAASPTAPATQGDLLQSILRARRAIASQPFNRVKWSDAPQELVAAATQAVAGLADDPRAMIASGDRALARGDYRTADVCFSRAVELAPKDLDALQGLAMVLVTAYRYAEAVPVYRRLIDLAEPQHDQALVRAATFNLAVALSRLGQFDEAGTLYRQLLDRDKDFVQARFNLATLQQAQGQLSDAAASWQAVIAQADKLTSPDAATAYSCLGQVLMDLEQPAKAMDVYARLASKLTPDSADAWLDLSAAARQAGSYGRAVEAIKRALEIAPDNDDAWARLGGLYLELHRATGKNEFLARAVDAWQRSMQLQPNQPAIRSLLDQYRDAMSSQHPQATTQ